MPAEHQASDQTLLTRAASAISSIVGPRVTLRAKVCAASSSSRSPALGLGFGPGQPLLGGILIAIPIQVVIAMLTCESGSILRELQREGGSLRDTAAARRPWPTVAAVAALLVTAGLAGGRNRSADWGEQC